MHGLTRFQTTCSRKMLLFIGTRISASSRLGMLFGLETVRRNSTTLWLLHPFLLSGTMLMTLVMGIAMAKSLGPVTRDMAFLIILILPLIPIFTPDIDSTPSSGQWPGLGFPFVICFLFLAYHLLISNKLSIPQGGFYGSLV